MLHYILWNADPEIFELFGRGIKWYGVLFAGSFYLAAMMLRRILLKKDMKDEQINKLIIFLVVGCLIGLRLGHCLFYEPGYYLSNPVEILKIWKGGLASHGAAIGILIALYLFIRKTNYSYLWLLDRIVIVVLFIAPFIRTGNLMNSEIIGDKTNMSHAFIFVKGIDDELVRKNGKYIDKTTIHQVGKDTVVDNILYSELNIEVYFNKNIPKNRIGDFLHQLFIQRIDNDSDLKQNIKLFIDKPNIEVIEQGGKYKAAMTLYGIPRHPSQVYEALAYLSFFIIFIIYYVRQKGMIREGFLFGMFLILVFGFRFFVEFLKEVQVSFESTMLLNMGQLLSLPLVILGIFIVIRSRKKVPN